MGHGLSSKAEMKWGLQGGKASSKKNNYCVPMVYQMLYWNFTKFSHLMQTAAPPKEGIDFFTHMCYLYVIS